MRFITRNLLKIFVKDSEEFQKPEVRAKYGYLEAWVSIVVNTALSIIKLILGIISNSIALIADAFHTFSDVITSGIVLAGFKISRRPADKEHPFGHGRIEPLSTLIIGVLLVVAG
ncbi:MAG: cation diffusion facilitator family transporter, partial [Candidatus Omnitrophica bacterium]|nr:cation diffusion facilitator family transporter [Candidatus Omnitrophota bacterium]